MSQRAAFHAERITILSGQTLSGAIRVESWVRGGFQLPATFTGTAITYQVSVDGAVFKSLRDNAGAAISTVVAQDQMFAFPEAVFGFAAVKLVSGSAEGADRAINCYFKY